MSVDRDQIEEFLYREARLLDEGRFDEWLALFAAEAIYWLPAGGADVDPNEHISIIYDDRAALEKRIARLKSGYAHAQNPPSRTHRLISNVEVSEMAEDGTRVTVSSVMILFALTRHRETVHSSRCEFSLMRNGGDWKIARKKVSLLRNREALECIPYLV